MPRPCASRRRTRTLSKCASTSTGSTWTARASGTRCERTSPLSAGLLRAHRLTRTRTARPAITVAGRCAGNWTAVSRGHRTKRLLRARRACRWAGARGLRLSTLLLRTRLLRRCSTRTCRRLLAWRTSGGMRRTQWLLRRGTRRAESCGWRGGSRPFGSRRRWSCAGWRCRRSRFGSRSGRRSRRRRRRRRFDGCGCGRMRHWCNKLRCGSRSRCWRWSRWLCSHGRVRWCSGRRNRSRCWCRWPA